MWRTRVKIDSESPDLCRERLRTIKFAMAAAYLALLLWAASVQVYYFYKSDTDFFNAHIATFDMIIIARGALKFITDLFMMTIFLANLRFFIQKKTILSGGSLTQESKRGLRLIYAMFTFQSIVILTNVLFTFSVLSFYQSNKDLIFVLRILIQPVTYAAVFSTCVGFIFFFYKRGVQELSTH